MSSAPEGIVLKRDRDLEGRLWHPVLRRSLLGLLVLVLVLALFDIFGQSPSTNRAVAPGTASLAIQAPEAARGGLLFQARFTIEAESEIKAATLVLGRGWLDGLTINTIEPSPVNEASRDGSLVFELGHLPAGSRYVLYVQYQVNPTTLSTRTLTTELEDGEQHLLTIDKPLTLFP